MKRHLLRLLVLAVSGVAIVACGSRNEEYLEGAQPLAVERDRESTPSPTKRGASGPSADPHARTDRPPRVADPHGGAVDPHAGTVDPHGGAVDPHAGARPTPPSSPSAPGEPAAGGVRWTVPDAFVTERPASSMRAAQYRVPRASGDEQDAQITVFYFGPGQGGAVQDNIDRWVGQVEQPDGRQSRDVAETTRRTVNGMPVTIVSVLGRLGGGGMPGMPPSPRIERGRLLGAIVEGPNGPVFFKMTGPAATVSGAESAFDELIGSFRSGG